jgi:3-dehydroquinate synthetase
MDLNGGHGSGKALEPSNNFGVRHGGCRGCGT